MSNSPIGYGGVEISAGEVTVSNSEFIQVIGFAIHATDYASVTATMNDISYVTYGEADSSGNVSDGFALWVESGSTLTTNGNTLQYNFLGIMADEADIVLSNDYIGNGLYGIFGLQGDMYMDNLVVENNYVWGILLAGSGDDYTISNTQVIGEPELVATGEFLDGSSIGIQMQTSGGEISDTTVSGYNYIGINLTPYDSAIDVTMTNVDVDEAGTFGIMASQGDYTLNNVNVTNHRTPYDPYTEDGSSIQSGFATSFWYANTTWIGGGVSDSEFIGSLVAWSSLSMDGTLISGNASRGIWNYESTVVLSGCTVSDSSPDGGINAIYADTTIDGCTFSDNNATDYWEYESSDGSNYGYLYYYRSTDIISQSASRLEVTNNTFTNGSRSIQTYSDANVLIKDNNWTNYNTDVMAFYSSADTAIVEDNVITESGGGMIYANSGDVEINNLSITDTRDVISTTTYFQDGVETSTSESQYSSDLFTAYYLSLIHI